MKTSLVSKRPKLKTYYITSYRANWISKKDPIQTYDIVQYLMNRESQDSNKVVAHEGEPYSFDIFGITIAVYKIRYSDNDGRFSGTTTYYVHEKDSKILDKIAEKYFR